MTDPILEALGMSTKPTKKEKKKKIIDDYENEDNNPFDLQGQKLKEEVRKLRIGNEKEIGNLIEKQLVISILNEIGHTIQTVFVDRGRRESALMAAKLGIPEKERELEKMLNDQDERGINTLLDTINKLCDDGVFE